MRAKQIPLDSVATNLPEGVAVIGRYPSELEELLGIRFERGTDNLDEFQGAAFSQCGGGIFLLQRHKHYPLPGTCIWVEQSDVEVAAKTLTHILADLCLTRSDLIWVRPELDL